MKPVLQTESAECALACLAMIANAHGLHFDLPDLRRRFQVSLKGANLKQVLLHATSLGFSGRPLRLELHELKDLACPCILHWDLNHFVVLRHARGERITIVDPRVGERSISLEEASKHFTGVALELTRSADFRPQPASPRMTFRHITGLVRGLKRSLAQIFAVALVLELFVIIGPMFNQMVIDEVLGSGDSDLMTVLVLGFGLLLLIQAAIGLARSWMVMVLSQTLSLQWMNNVFAHMVRLPVDFFDKRHLGDVVSRFGSVSTIQKTLTTRVIEVLLDGLMVVAALAMMLIYAPVLSAVTCSAVVIYGLLRWMAYRPLRDATAERLVISARENTHFLETLRAIRALKLFGREEERRSHWQNLVVDVQNRDVHTTKLNILFSTAHTFVFGLENLLVFWLGAKIVMSGQVAGGTPFTVGMLIAFITYKNQFGGRVAALINYWVELRMLSLHVDRLADITLTPPDKNDTVVRELGHLTPSLEFCNVSFRYGDGEPWVLHKLSFKIELGECVAITGASGAGKTTLLKIMLGLLSPTEGEVLYGGAPVEQLGWSNLRRVMGTVMQDDVLLSGSLVDNISFFDTQPDQQWIEFCSRAVNLADEILAMPMGYQTLVGDLGAGLSGGQKQRVLLARALYKRPSLLILDEATNNLDVANEKIVIQKLREMGLTSVVISHRPEAVEAADRVLEVRRGHTHEGQRSRTLALTA